MTTKTCKRCKIAKPADRQHFPRSEDNSDRLQRTCRECLGLPAPKPWVFEAHRKDVPIIKTYKSSTQRAKETMKGK